MKIEKNLKEFELCIQENIDVINRHELWIKDNPENVEGIKCRRRRIKWEKENMDYFVRLYTLYHVNMELKNTK